MSEPSPQKKQRVETANAMADASQRRGRLLRVPFVYPYQGGQHFYERECYDKYYALVEGLLQSGSTCVTVTGTPGIGKSVFYAYFAERFLKTHDNVCIIAAASPPDGCTEVAIFDKEKDPIYSDTKGDAASMIDNAARRAKHDGKALLQLWDGPPKERQPYGQTVVFTSPDETWLKFADKLGCIYYMPLWTCEELHTAARVLGLPLVASQIDARFRIFGGTARYCLHPKPEEVARVTREICAAISGITNRQQLKQLLVGTETTRIHQYLLHYQPGKDSESMMVKSSVLASPFVEERLVARVLSLVSRERQRIREWLRAVPVGTGLRDRTFEGETLDALRHCRLLQLEPLVDATSARRTETVTITASSDAQAVPKEATPSADWESIDGVFELTMTDNSTGGPATEKTIALWNERQKSRLLLFYPTVLMAPNVDAVGLVHVFRHLGLLEVVARNPERAALVFVVPREDVGLFGHQEITVMSDDRISSIHGTGEETVKMLEKTYKIQTIQDLQRKMVPHEKDTLTIQEGEEAPSAEAYEGGLNHGLVAPGVNYCAEVAKIPQYVCTWEESSGSNSDVLGRACSQNPLAT